jgi:hypothetical protein
MAIAADEAQDVPMSVRMRRVLAAVRRMPAADRLQILVKAGLMTAAEAQQAVGRLTPVKRARRKARTRPTAPAKKAVKPRKP